MATLPRPRRSAENGYEARGTTAFAVGVSEIHGLPITEAETALTFVYATAERIGELDDTTQAVADGMKVIEDLETRFGKHENWDELRLVIGVALLCNHAFDTATPILAQSHHLGAMLEELEAVFERPEIAAVLSEDDITTFYAQLAQAIRETGDTTELHRLRHWMASWNHIDAIAAAETMWPETVDAESRRAIANMFGRLQHDMVSDAATNARAHEPIQAYIASQEIGQPADVWDHWRAMAALSLFTYGADAQGVEVVAAMGRQSMQVETAQLLIQLGNDNAALQVAMQLPSHSLRGEVLMLGNWHDKELVVAIMEAILAPDIESRYSYDERIAMGQGMLKAAERMVRAASNPASEEYWQKRVIDITIKLEALGNQS